MRYQRLLLLLFVVLCAAPAAADDHRVDLNFGTMFASGSYLLGGRVAVGYPVKWGEKTDRTTKDLTKPVSAIFDVAIQSGKDQSGYEKRQTIAGGVRYTLPQRSPHHKLHLQGLAGYGSSKVEGSDNDGVAGVFGIGWEFVPEPRNGSISSHGFGLAAQLDTVFAKGQDAQVRLSLGLVYRIKQEH